MTNYFQNPSCSRRDYSSHDYNHKLIRHEPELHSHDITDTIIGWLLGPESSEMIAVEDLLINSGQKLIAYAETDKATRVTRSTAYKAMGGLAGNRRYLVGCNFEKNPQTIYDLNYDQDGDRGYSIPPVGFMFASSIGQVLSELVKFGIWTTNDLFAYEHSIETGEIRWDWSIEKWIIGVGTICGCSIAARIPDSYVYLAAGSFCLAAAYDRQCPGIDPGKLLISRIKSPSDREEVTNGRLLLEGKKLKIGEMNVIDVRWFDESPQILIEMAAFNKICVIGSDNGKTFIGGAASADHVAQFMLWASENGFKNIWRSPARGYAEAF